jgi:hypothetical protein
MIMHIMGEISQNAVMKAQGIVHIGDRDLDKTDRENLKFMYPL